MDFFWCVSHPLLILLLLTSAFSPVEICFGASPLKASGCRTGSMINTGFLIRPALNDKTVRYKIWQATPPPTPSAAGSSPVTVQQRAFCSTFQWRRLLPTRGDWEKVSWYLHIRILQERVSCCTIGVAYHELKTTKTNKRIFQRVLASEKKYFSTSNRKVCLVIQHSCRATRNTQALRDTKPWLPMGMNGGEEVSG